MRCPKHPEVWLYENMMETEGFCPKCQEWYPLKEDWNVGWFCPKHGLVCQEGEENLIPFHRKDEHCSEALFKRRYRR